MPTQTGPGTPAQLSVGSPRHLTSWSVLIISCYGLLLGLPVLVSMMVVSVMPFTASTILLPILTFTVATFFLPLGFGNPHVRKLVSKSHPGAARGPGSFVVQLRLSPRIEGGVRGLIEDADDFGMLTLTDSGLRFEGDAINATIPFQQIERVECKNIGWRGLFLCKQRVIVGLNGVSGTKSLEFAERSSWVLPASRSTTERLCTQLSALMGRA